ncbi:XrtA-associated tyrosine autokinase [Oceanidesulfovibrio marinus]|uniref:Polysaccharide biosynthesis protein n=1 Tax=Oceanidesulfovibrio marinus TaxID=370038 RepID=A0A6M4XJ81_9BACT|nr:XrtA-associated tyrosine autokinase [Oceanidesulfovibrio marinus]QJT07963.1 polysaccharide biosynthesis tyrosine autokinase [Oceanidesulfovibrio marinus]TVM33461.1 polysaccharide biosynthesis protein [Oceanidesulfovibrio marinus]
MSRIEESIAKALKMRNGTTPPPARPEVEPAEDRRRKTFAPQTTPLQVRSELIVMAQQPHSPIAEEYRKLKEAIIKQTRRDNEFRNTIMVTSALAGEGKTLTAINLAMSLAQEYDNTVLLVDGDLRRPSIGGHFDLDVKTGLAQCLTGEADIGDVLVRTGHGKLAVLPSGPPSYNALELFSSRWMADLVLELKHRYDDRYIIFDTPPVLPFAEARLLSKLVDSVLLVVREGVPTPDHIADTLQALGGATILGAVYNDSKTAPAESYGYAYGKSAKESRV